ncbi:MAG TPA: FadR/GntR family transcriptional regulator [Victivallales bacterium]|nr:FadR/GntR family transcriptional regulator [Victivallales bacterium]
MNENKHSKVYRKIITDIQNQIVSGQLQLGDKLPAERTLVSNYNVSRSSVREALRTLEIIGIIESRHGDGNYIANNISDFCFEPISLSFQLQNGKIEDIFELRNMFEIRSSILAAKNITDMEKQELKKLLTNFDNVSSAESVAEYDKKIHKSIAKYSKNILLITLYSAVEKLVEFTINYRSSTVSMDNSLIEIHKNLCRAIINRDPHAAKRYAEEHATMFN